jgi:hypothetical protein
MGLMKLVLANLLPWLARQATTSEEAEDREDIAYIEMAKKDACFRPLREVLAELDAKDEAEERGKLRRPVRQAS